MTDPASLPVEIFDAILHYASIDIVSTDPQINHRFAQKVRNRTSQLAGYCLLSRRWHECTVPHLYSTFECDGYTNSFARCWNFLSTIESCPELRNLVKYVHIRDVGESHCVEGSLEPRQPDDEIVLTRLDRAKAYEERAQSLGINMLKIKRALRDENIAPLSPLLQSYLPNLERVQVIMKEADQRGLVFDKLVSDPLLWSRLTEATFYVSAQLCYSRMATSPFCISCIAPLLKLYRIKKISVIAASFDCWSLTSYRDHRCPKHKRGEQYKVCPQGGASRVEKGISNVTHVVATADEDSATSGILHFLEAPRTLRSLSLGFPENLVHVSHNLLHNTELWQLLNDHRNTLEYLDLYRPDRCRVKAGHVQEVERLQSLKEFPRLKRVFIQPEQLLGTPEGQDPKVRVEASMLRLKDVLPPSLTFLALYRDNQYENVMPYWEQISELGDTISFPNLQALMTTQDPRHVENSWKVDVNRKFHLYCIERAFLPRGGLNHIGQPESKTLDEYSEYKGCRIT